MPFFTIYNRRKRNLFQQDLSNQIEPVYELDKETNSPKKVGETNIYEKIQQYKDECDVYNVLKRFESGDVSVIQVPTPENSIQGVDFTKYPKNFFENKAILDQALSNWQKMPKGLRDLYENKVSKFMEASPEDISKNIDIYARSLVPESKPDVGGDK